MGALWAICLSFIFFAMSQCTIISRKYTAKLEMDDKKSNEVLLGEHKSTSVIECAARCQEKCRFYGFNPKMEKCRTHKKIFSSDVSNEVRWRYYSHVFPPKDCKDLRDNGHSNTGVYEIYPFGIGSSAVRVFCDMEIMDGGWTAIQKRVNGSLRFNRTWTEYKNGFGDPDKEVWTGNDIIHQLTKEHPSSLYVSITLQNGTTLYEMYDQFSVSDEAGKYQLFLAGPATGTLGKFSHPCFPFLCLLDWANLTRGDFKSSLIFFTPKDCKDLHDNGRRSTGVYEIYPFGIRSRAVRVFCDMEIMDGGWTGIQKRVNGSLRFNRTWTKYKNRFGNPDKEGWIGNDVIHQLTKEHTSSLYVSITLQNGTTLYEMYDRFSVSDEAGKYQLFLTGPATRTLGDVMLETGSSYRNLSGMYFSTSDRDNDRLTGANCATVYGGGGGGGIMTVPGPKSTMPGPRHTGGNLQNGTDHLSGKSKC